MNIEISSRLFQVFMSSFKGCLIGGLLGDAYGRPFEGASNISKENVVRFFYEESKRPKGNYLKWYSDDTVMTIDIVKSLTKYPGFNSEDMAKNFAQSWISSTIPRYYGASVGTIFENWLTNNFQNLLTPAKKQFKNQGSFGNGAAMRVSPIGLLFYPQTDSLAKVVDYAIKTSLLTHTHPLGVGGAIFQTVAIRNMLKSRINLAESSDEQTKAEINMGDILNDIEQDLDYIIELGTIKTKVKSSYIVEINVDTAITPYTEKLKVIRTLLEKENVDDRDVISNLGNGIEALDSVPTALYCFLQVLKDQDAGDVTCLFEKTLQYAISLGGDTDTIASMAGSLAGTFLGHEAIPTKLQTSSEGVNEMVNLAEKLFDTFYKSNSNENNKDSGSKL